MEVRELIRKKRLGQSYTGDEIQALVDGFVSGEIADYQATAWLMAVCFQGLDKKETAALTQAMARSGKSVPRQLSFDFWIDKHSTGGVGDKLSLILVPLVLSVCRRQWKGDRGGVKLPMISGRGLGHTGGTLDKLESIPGFRVGLPLEQMATLLEEQGAFIAGQTRELVPADRYLYALRDVTATIDCRSLIVSSILSKKLSENLDALVIDLKCGEGAFLPDPDEARELGAWLVDIGRALGCETIAVMTPMDEPIGDCVGNALEVEETMAFLRGTRREPKMTQTIEGLASWMVHLASRGLLSLDEATAAVREELKCTEPVKAFLSLVEAQGGDWGAFEKRPKDCPQMALSSPSNGYVQTISARGIAELVTDLGGGRNKAGDAIDFEVGVEFHKKVGEAAALGEPLATVFYRREEQKAEIERRFQKAVEVGGTAPKERNAVMEVIGE